MINKLTLDSVATDAMAWLSATSLHHQDIREILSPALLQLTFRRQPSEHDMQLTYRVENCTSANAVIGKSEKFCFRSISVPPFSWGDNGSLTEAEEIKWISSCFHANVTQALPFAKTIEPDPDRDPNFRKCQKRTQNVTDKICSQIEGLPGYINYFHVHSRDLNFAVDYQNGTGMVKSLSALRETSKGGNP